MPARGRGGVSGRRAWFILLSGDSYSAATKTKRSFVFQVNVDVRSACMLHATYACAGRAGGGVFGARRGGGRSGRGALLGGAPCLVVAPLGDLQPLHVGELHVRGRVRGVEDVCARGEAGRAARSRRLLGLLGGGVLRGLAGGCGPVRVARMAMPARSDPAYVTRAFVR